MGIVKVHTYTHTLFRRPHLVECWIPISSNSYSQGVVFMNGKFKVQLWITSWCYHLPDEWLWENHVGILACFFYIYKVVITISNSQKIHVFSRNRNLNSNFCLYGIEYAKRKSGLKCYFIQDSNEVIKIHL